MTDNLAALLRKSNTPPSARQAGPLDPIATWLITLSQLFPQLCLTPGVVEVYRRVLAEYSADAIDRGFLEAIKRSRSAFAPSPGDVLAAIADTQPAVPVPEKLALPEPTMTPPESRQFFAEVRTTLDALAKKKTMDERHHRLFREARERREREPEGTIEITDEMLERHEAKKREAIDKFKEK